MVNKIAIIKLAPGNRTFFDPLTGINLNQSNKVAIIYDNMKLDNIREGLKTNKIKLAEGRLPSANTLIRETVKEIEKSEIELNKIKLPKLIEKKEIEETPKILTKEKNKKIITNDSFVVKPKKEKVVKENKEEEVE